MHTLLQGVTESELLSFALSGTWLNNCAWLDGDKLVCMDLLKDAIDNGDCLIYSFGLGSDWSFEHMFADMGCTVRAFDPTVIQEPENIHANIHFKQFGISNISGLSEVCTICVLFFMDELRKSTISDFPKQMHLGYTLIT